MNIGILALQGAFVEHERALRALGATTFEIRQKRDLVQKMDGLILPGGESTVMRKLLHEQDMFSVLHDAISSGLPVFGTCAGLLLLAEHIKGGTPCFGTMHLRAMRNAYGRQLGSFHTKADFASLGDVPMTFIRAPYIAAVSEGVQILATTGGHIVAAREGNQLVSAFHPELDNDPTIHQYFLDMI